MKLWTGTLYLLARLEVTRALLRNQIEGANECEDALPPSLIPSVRLNNRDCVLAEIDQDGFLFAIEQCDIPFFNTKEVMAPRKYHRLQIVLTKGAIRIRKSSLCRKSGSFLSHIRDLLQWELYLEAAALLRLRGLENVPAIRRIDPRQGTIEMDYVWGRDLRQIISDGRREIDYEDVSRVFSNLVSQNDGEISRQISDLLTKVMGRGVIPRDIHAANFIRAWHSERLYLVDFNLVYLRPLPGWRSHARKLAWILGSRPVATDTGRD